MVHHYSDEFAGYVMRGRELTHEHKFDLLVNDFYMFKVYARIVVVHSSGPMSPH